MEKEKPDLTPAEQWALSQRMIDAFRQPGPLSPEMQKIMNRNLPDEDVWQTPLRRLGRRILRRLKYRA